MLKARKFIPLLVVAAGLLAYHNSFTVPFIFDDVKSIPGNPTIRHLWPIWEVLSPPRRGGTTVEGRPLINLSLAINYAISGTRVWGYHALNLAIHILAGCTLFGIVRRTLLQPRLRARFGAGADGLALATAVLWTVHPLQTESVTYIIQRAESLMGLLYLATLYFFLRGTASSRPGPWYGLSVAACALGMASKEVMASVPLMVVLYDRAFLSGTLREAWRRRWRLYLALAGTWIVLAWLMLFAGSMTNAVGNARIERISWWEYLLTEPGVVRHYLRLSLWPHPLCFDYNWPIARTWTSILPPALVLIILLGATAWALAANSIWGFVGAWFFLILAPTSSLLPLDSPIYEHRLYLPLAAIVSAVCVGGFELGKKLLSKRQQMCRLLEWAGAGALALLLVALTIQRNEDYRSDLAIWEDTLQKSPNNPRTHNCLGVALIPLGRLPEAIAHLEEALRLRPEYADAHYNLGLALGLSGRTQASIEQYRQALRFTPGYLEAYNNLATALAQLGRMSEAIAAWEAALRLDPNVARVHYNLAIAMEQTGQTPVAAEQFQEALRIDPQYAEAHFGLGNLLGRSGRLEDAIAQYRQVLQINADYTHADLNLGEALVKLGRPEEAIGYFQDALRVEPNYLAARISLANALVRTGKVDEAIPQFQQALQIDPNSADAHYDFGVALERVGRVQDAAMQYEQAVKLNPDMSLAKNALLQLHAH